MTRIRVFANLRGPSGIDEAPLRLHGYQSPEGCLTLTLRLDHTRSEEDEHQRALRGPRRLSGRGSRRSALDRSTNPHYERRLGATGDRRRAWRSDDWRAPMTLLDHVVLQV